MREYQQKNSEACKERAKKYREERRDEMYAPHLCECGGTFVERHRKRHSASKKHQKYLAGEGVSESVEQPTVQQ